MPIIIPFASCVVSPPGSLDVEFDEVLLETGGVSTVLLSPGCPLLLSPTWLEEESEEEEEDEEELEEESEEEVDEELSVDEPPRTKPQALHVASYSLS